MNFWIDVWWIVLLILLLGIILIVKRLYFPTIIPYPWPVVKKDKTTKVVLAGSYNPPHFGHFAMLIYLSERYVLHSNFFHVMFVTINIKQNYFLFYVRNNKYKTKLFFVLFCFLFFL